MPGYNRERLLSSFFDNVTFDQVCAVLDTHIANHIPGYMMSLNLDILIRADKDPEFRAALESADLILMDSAPLMKITHKQGIDCVEKLSGSDLMPRICEFAASKGYSCAIVGGMPGVPEKAAASLSAQYPGLLFKGAISPEYGFEKDSAKLQMLLSKVAGLNADVDRAPKWMQDHSLEWFYRFVKEPRRLFKRYFIDSWHFLAMCFKRSAQ